MTGIRRNWLKGTAVALCLGLLAQQGIAQPVVLTAEQMQQTAFVLIRQGQPEKALAYADALLKNMPQDASVLVMKSRAERDLARNAAAVKTARLAWKYAKTRQQSYSAAMAMAQGLSSNGNKFAAQFWLRRAIDLAENPLARSIAETDFKYVRSRSRLALRFAASLQPSSNLNNGSSSRILNFLGLPFTLSGDALALSGVEGSLAATANYTLAETEAAKTSLRFGVTQKLVRLSDAARAQAPDARNGDYAFGGVEIGLEQRNKLDPLRAELVSGLSFGKNWYGGDPLSQYLRLDLSVTKNLSPHWQGNLRLSGEQQDRLDNSARSADILTLAAGLRHPLANGDQISLGLRALNVQSGSIDIDHHTVGASLDWVRAKPVFGTQISAGLSVETSRYSASLYALNGRDDVTVAANVSMAFKDIDYMGFIPVLNLEAQRTDSNVSLYQSDTLGLGLSIQSKF